MKLHLQRRNLAGTEETILQMPTPSHQVRSFFPPKLKFKIQANRNSAGRRKESVPPHVQRAVEILKENHSSTTEQKRDALHELIRISKENSPEIWQNSFTPIILAILDTLRHPDVSFILFYSILFIYASALPEGTLHPRPQRGENSPKFTHLQQLLKNQSPRDFESYVNAILLALLERTIDPHREVSQASLECLEQTTHAFPAETCVQVWLVVD